MTEQTRHHILHTEWSKGWGGQEIRILGESLSLINSGMVVHIAAQPDSQLAQKALEAGIPVHKIKMHKGPPFISILRLVRTIFRENIDIIHTHSSVDARIAGIAGKLLRKPVVRSRHLSTPIKQRWWSWFLYMRLADHVITSGESIRQDMINNNKMLPEKITSIPAGIDTDIFYPRPTDLNLKEKLGLSNQHFIVGIVAVLRSWKGHRALFEGISLYKKINQNIRLLVLGDGPTRSNLETLRKELDLEEQILMLGHIADTPRYYSIMDVVILTSYSNEATSQTLPQAMLMEKSVIGTDIGSIPEVVIDGKTGILIAPNNPHQISDALHMIEQDHTLRDRLSTAGRKHALKNFTKKSMMNSTIAIYNKVTDLTWIQAGYK